MGRVRGGGSTRASLSPQPSSHLNPPPLLSPHLNPPPATPPLLPSYGRDSRQHSYSLALGSGRYTASSGSGVGGLVGMHGDDGMMDDLEEDDEAVFLDVMDPTLEGASRVCV